MQMAPVNLIEAHSLSFLKVISVNIQENKILIFAIFWNCWSGGRLKGSVLFAPVRTPLVPLRSGLPLAVFCLCVWRRSAPELSAAEVTRVVLFVAVMAQWSHLTVCPLLIWQSICRLTPVTEAACRQAAINARPAEHPILTPGEHLKLGRHGQARTRAMGDRPAVVNVCWFEPDGHGRTAASELPCSIPWRAIVQLIVGNLQLLAYEKGSN